MLTGLRRARQWRMAELALLSLLHIPAFQECWGEVNTMARREAAHADHLENFLRTICSEQFAAMKRQYMELEGATYCGRICITFRAV